MQQSRGKVKFFSDDLQEFAWHNLLNKRLSGQERMDLYVQAISSFSVSKQLPQLFRDIFKDTFLPYRDPETLSLFLKEIDEFTYDHSEDLGDAFEYLLSILGSQGDAGQFRTPRHIIDFIAEVVDPKKNETILDPACGTAGFLISAYKHILGNHDGLDNETGKPTDKEKHLTPDERQKMMNNFVGYDISPDMVKLSLVNMYLHGFQEPKIYEYDTLTSEKNWDEQFDVIMANPPFMSPKGGIRPHKRFSVQAKRSEVLFVDYILEHLSLKGRAGIIVPEGIIFKAENAYKQLRQMLVEDGLFAVVSLPPGVFNPYSGVKTSILFFDNQLAEKVKHILFVKMHADGFSLGAQRQPVSTNDIPAALEAIKGYREHVLSGGRVDKGGWPNILEVDTNPLCQFVSKQEIAESKDYNLTGDKYREVETHKNQKWPRVELGEVTHLMTGGTPLTSNKEYYNNGNIKWLVSGDIHKEEIFDCKGRITELALRESNAQILPLNSVLIALNGQGKTRGTVAILRTKAACNQSLVSISPDLKKLTPEFLLYVLKSKYQEIRNINGDNQRGGLNMSLIRSIKITLPPLKIQKEIVEQIEVKQNAINHAKEIIKNLEKERRYFGQDLKKLKDVEWVELGEICEIQSGGTPKRNEEKYWNGDIPWLGSAVCKNKEIHEAKEFITKEGLNNSSAKLFKINTTLLALVGATIGKTALLKFEASTNQNIAGLYPKNENKLDSIYLLLAIQSQYQRFLDLGDGKFKMANLSFVKKLKIPFPPIKVQKQLVIEVEKEEEIITANCHLIELMEGKIDKVLKAV